MTKWRRHIYRYQTATWLIAGVLVVQLLFQLQFHLHHDQDAPVKSGHDHIVDYHFFAEGHHNSHDKPVNTHELKSIPDVIVKKNLDNSLSVLFVCISLLTPVVIIRISRNWSLLKNEAFRVLYYGLSPPLRAPPVN